MSSGPIIIVGAGLTGVTLGRCLLSKGLLPLVIEKSSPSPRRHDYSIDLHSASYRPLLRVLELEEATFKRRVSVHKDGATAELSTKHESLGESANFQESFRCHRGRLEALLGEGLSIKWQHTAARITPGPSYTRVEIENELPLETQLLVAADGVHSAVRNALISDLKPDVHPYVVFYGTRTISTTHFATSIAGEMHSGGLLETRCDNALLRIFLNNVTSAEVILGYTYSRAAHVGTAPDVLHNPERSQKGARDIPEAFYAELSALRNLSSVFAEIFDPERVRQDRVLHWLMRSILPGSPDLVYLAENGVVMVGDAGHAMPILGGEGGNEAIRDGIELAEWIVANGTKDMGGFVSARYLHWKEAIKKGVQTLHNAHRGERPSL